MARARWIVIAPALVIAAGRVVRASPVDDPSTGPAAFTGAVSPDPSSIVGNPAALDLGSEGTHLWLGGVARIDQYRLTLDREDASGNLTPGPAVTDTTWSPGGQFAAYTVQHDFSLGAMIDLPPAEEHPEGGDALRYHTLGGGQREKIYAAVAGSLQVFEGFYIGGSAQYVETSIDLAFARDTALESGRPDVATTGLENPAADQIYTVHASTGPTAAQDKIAFTMGAVWKVSPRVAIGAVFREPQGVGAAVGTEGTVGVTPAPRTGGPAVGGLATIAFVPPQIFEVGARVRAWEAIDAVGGARWERTSRTAQYDLRMFGKDVAGVAPEWYPRARGWRDVVEAWGGLEQVDDGQPLLVGARLGVESGAVAPGELSPLQVEGWSMNADLGARVRLHTHLVIAIGYDVQYYPAHDVGASAYDPIARLDCIDSDYDYSTPACAAVRAGFGTDTAAGHYARLGHVFHLGLRYDFL